MGIQLTFDVLGGLPDSLAEDFRTNLSNYPVGGDYSIATEDEY
jgi:hypothetical protein